MEVQGQQYILSLMGWWKAVAYRLLPASPSWCIHVSSFSWRCLQASLVGCAEVVSSSSQRLRRRVDVRLCTPQPVTEQWYITRRSSVTTITNLKHKRWLSMIFCNTEAICIVLYQCTAVSSLYVWSADFHDECYPEHRCMARTLLICFINRKHLKWMEPLAAT